MQWILSNENRPDIDGTYYCKDSVGVKSMVDFYNGRWHSSTGHPVEFWLDESPSPKEKELREALEGDEVPPLHRIGWLGTLLRACNREPVYSSLVKDAQGDFDAVNVMLNNLFEMERKATEALKQ